MTMALVVLALGLLLLAAAPRGGECEHEFVADGSADFGDHRSISYRCEKCGAQVNGQA